MFLCLIFCWWGCLWWMSDLVEGDAADLYGWRCSVCGEQWRSRSNVIFAHYSVGDVFGLMMDEWKCLNLFVSSGDDAVMFEWASVEDEALYMSFYIRCCRWSVFVESAKKYICLDLLIMIRCWCSYSAKLWRMKRFRHLVLSADDAISQRKCGAWNNYIISCYLLTILLGRSAKMWRTERIFSGWCFP